MELTRNRQVRVVAWPAVAAYLGKHASPDLGKASREVGARAVLALPVRREGDRLRIAALLVLPEKGHKEWAGEYERGAADTFAVQRELARTIADEASRAIERIR